MNKQHTIAKAISLTGIGLHTGNSVNITFRPAPDDAGISFIRTDLAHRPVIQACVHNSILQSPSPRRTSLGGDNGRIYTIEHLMSALLGRGIDNLIIEIDNEEIPGLDGSSLNFVEALTKAGLEGQEKERRYYAVKEAIVVEEEGASLIALPSDEFKISYTLDYNHPFIKTDFLEINIDPDSFTNEIAPARKHYPEYRSHLPIRLRLSFL